MTDCNHFRKDARMTRLFSLFALLLALSIPSVAAAQDPVTDTYGGNGPGIVDEVPGGDVAPDVTGGGDNTTREGGSDAPDAGGSLPFTGADLGLLAVGGLLLVGLGMGMRRVTRTRA